MFNPTKSMVEAARETRAQPLYDSRALPTTFAAAVNFFDTVSSDPAIGNVLVANQLPAPRQFLVEKIGLYIDSSAAHADVQLLINKSGLIWSISDKEYWRGPAWMAPGGGGAAGFAATTATTTTLAATTNGLPLRGNSFQLKPPGQLIRPQENFKASIAPLGGTQTLSAITRVWWVFYGLEMRAVQ